MSSHLRKCHHPSSFLCCAAGKLRIMICDMDEIKGTNEKTGANTRESLLCIDYTRKS